MLETLHSDSASFDLDLSQPIDWWEIDKKTRRTASVAQFPGGSATAVTLMRESDPGDRLQMLCERIDRAKDPIQAISCLIDALDSLVKPALVCVALPPSAVGGHECVVVYQQAHGPLRKVRLQPSGHDQDASETRATLDPSVFSCVLPEIRETLQQSRQRAIEPLLLSLGQNGVVSGLLMIVPSHSRPVSAHDRQLLKWPLMSIEATMHRLYLKEERQRLESQMARMGADLSQMQERVMQTEQLASIGELVSGVAHELNNPLTSVIGYSQLLLSSDVPEHIKPDLEIVDSEAQRCQRIVQNLLGLARQDTVEISATDINDLIQRTLELKAYLLRVDNITVDLDLASDLAFVWANPCQVQQVLLNLVGNAHEAMAHASSSGTLSITSRYLGDEHSRPMVRVTISDDGPGVPPENRERIFESFFSTKRDQQGTGLGLSISRRIVREFGGELWLDDGPPVGACFVIDLPAHNSVARHQERDQETISRAKEGAARLLIVDDEADIANLLERLLGNTGYIVSTASDGYEAERLLYIGQYDLILLDFKMPGIDGPTIYDTARLTQSRETQIIFMTGDLANAKTAGWLEKVGCPVIEKPFDIKRVIRVVTQTLDAPH